MKKSVITLVLIMLSLLNSDPTWSDDSSLGRLGEGVYPLVETSVQLTAEQVVLAVTPANTRVDVNFVFFNPGLEDAELLLGFPEGEMTSPERQQFGDDAYLHDFKAYVNGQAVKTERREGFVPPRFAQDKGEMLAKLPAYSAWYTFPLTIKAGEQIAVRNTYWVKNYFWSNGEVETGYILRTGALWAGPIKKASIKVQLVGVLPYQLLGARPGNWTVNPEEPNVYVWEFDNWEPETDLKFHFSLRPSSAFWLEVPVVDQLLADQLFEDALKELEKYKVRSNISAEEVQGLAFREAFALQMAGRVAEAEILWNQLIFSAGNNQRQDHFYRVVDDPAAYYYLAETYLHKQDLDALQKLYDLLRYKMVSSSLLRWIEFHLPSPVKISVFSAGASLRMEGKQPVITVEAQDDRGNLEQGILRVWTQDNREEKVLLNETWDAYLGQGFRFQTLYALPFHLQTGTKINFLVTAVTATGQTVESTGSWTLPDPASTWGNPLGTIAIEGRVTKNMAGKEVYHDLGGYVLVPPGKWDGLAGYLLAAKGTVTDQVLYGKKVIVLEDYKILDKGETPAPPPAAKRLEANNPTGKPGSVTVIGRLQPVKGYRYRLETSLAEVLEFYVDKLPEAAGLLYLISGAKEKDDFAISHVIPLTGDLKQREDELAPFLVKARPFTLLIDNRGVEYADPPAQKKVEFRSSPLVLNGSILVDMMEIAELLDVSLGYHPGSKVITFEGRARPLKLGVEDNIFSGNRVGSHSSAVIRYDRRIYVPLRFVLEHYGYQVDYNPHERIISAHS